MTTHVDKGAVTHALGEEFASVHELLTELDDAEWGAPTPCPGWDVRAQVAHIIGTESMLAGIDAPVVEVDVEALDHVRNDIGGFNQRWVAALADAAPLDLLDRYRPLVASRLEALADMNQERWDTEGFTPAGRDTYGRFMRLRIFDIWMHEQDIRDAVGRPGHEAGPAVDQALEEMTGALGFVVGKQAAAPEGSSVTFELTGDSGRAIHVAVSDRARVVDDLDGPATVTLRMPVGTFTRLAGGRIGTDEVTDRIKVTGDETLGHRVLTNLAYTI
ncbi:maleylpyruvate isomerase family mycothiol-dependent enzyme [soil metagenome]